MNKEVCRKALKDLIHRLDDSTKCFDWEIGKWRRKRRYQRKIDVLRNLINQHFELLKAFDRACEVLDDLSRFTPKGSIIRTKEEWKEWCLKNE